MSRKLESLRFSLAEIEEKMSVVGVGMTDANENLINIEFQLQAHEHDLAKYEERYRLLKKADVPIVSLTEWRMLVGDLEFMTDLLAGLKKKRLTNQRKFKVLNGEYEELEAERARLKREIDVISSASNVIPFHRNDQRRDESQDPDRA